MGNFVTTSRSIVSRSRPARRIHPGRRQSAAILASTALSAFLLRRRLMRWGATDAELELALAGDELLPKVSLTSTRSITIDAAVAQVWPWLAQLGQGRGGFYSYDFLENLVGLDIHSADQIHPRWQHLTVGSPVQLAPQLALTVAVLEPGRALVLRGAVPVGAAAVPFDFTWAFTLHPGTRGRTRLVVRERYRYVHRWAGLIAQPAELVSCLMSPRMLRGIKRRAEQPAAGLVDAPPIEKRISA